MSSRLMPGSHRCKSTTLAGLVGMPHLWLATAMAIGVEVPLFTHEDHVIVQARMLGATFTAWPGVFPHHIIAQPSRAWYAVDGKLSVAAPEL